MGEHRFLCAITILFFLVNLFLSIHIIGSAIFNDDIIEASYTTMGSLAFVASAAYFGYVAAVLM